MTDVYGANLYNRYLGQQPEAMKSGAKLVALGTGSPITMEEQELVSAAECRSILVGRNSFCIVCPERTLKLSGGSQICTPTAHNRFETMHFEVKVRMCVQTASHQIAMKSSVTAPSPGMAQCD